MVRIVQPDIPPEWEEMWAKIVRWFDLHGIPVWCRMWFQTSRSQKEKRRAATKFPSAGSAWKQLDAATKIAWRSAAKAGWNYYRGYRMFVADYIYRLQNNLSLPGTPSDYHQLFGMVMDNPSGSSDIYMRRDDKDLIGPLTIKFSYKKDERTPSGSYAFKVQSTAYYFWAGQVLSHTDTFTSPAGDVAWNTITRNFGTSGLKYFHLKVIFTILNYDAKIYLDNIIWSDQNGEFFREHFNVESYGAWIPVLLYRKRDWVFNPAYITTYFKHEYLL